MRNPARTTAQFPGTRTLTAALSALLLSACALDSAIPGDTPPVSDRARAADWPELADQSVFADGPAPLTGETTPEDIAARAEALRLRALRLRRQVIASDGAERLAETPGA